MLSDLLKLPKGLAIALLVVIVLGGINSVYRAHNPEGSSEFRGFSRNVAFPAAAGKDIYTEVPHRRFYPLFFAVVFYPFAWTGTLVGAGLWYVVNVALGIGALVVAMRTVSDSPPKTLILAGLFSGIALILDCALRGEPDPWILFSLCLSFYLYTKKREFLAGLVGGFAGVMKVTPLLMFVYFLLKGRTKVLAGGVCALILFGLILPSLAFGPDYTIRMHESWYRNVVSPSFSAGPTALVRKPYRISHQSMHSALLRHFSRANLGKKAEPHYVNITSLSSEDVKRIAVALKVLIVGALTIAWLTPSRSTGLLETALIPPAMLELNDVSLTTHHLSLAFTLIVLFGYGGGQRRLARTAFYIGISGMYLIAIRPLKTYSILCVTTLTMFVLLFVLIFREKSLGSRKAGVSAKQESF